MAELKVLMRYMDDPDQKNIATYEKNGGYRAIEKAKSSMTPQQLIDLVLESGLRGRGGAGFETGKKWNYVPKDPTVDKYLVCNCDESEPGTFKDRLIIEKDPHQLIEGIILTCYAIGAKHAFIYCRGEFFEANRILRKAVEEAKSRGHLGSLRITVHPGAGAYIAGEETAQLNSLEGYRATPRLKPPFPAVSGLYGKPTIINNVETLCNVVHIVNNGLAWYTSIGKPKNTGTKIFQVSGHIQKPGCYEFALGTPLREIFDVAGGFFPGRKFKACYPGGSSCSLITAREIDLPMDFESLIQKKSALGTASIIVMDDSTDMVQVVHRLMQFYQNESCGKCTPCREGTRWLVQILKRMEEGKAVMRDLETIDDVCNSMIVNSFCPLAPGAAPPVLSAIAEFRDEFVRAIEKNPDRDRPQVMKIAYPYVLP